MAMVEKVCELKFARSQKGLIMKTLLRDKVNRLYFQGVSDWTTSAEQAFDFRIADRAVKFVRDAGLSKKEMELVLAFENPLYNVTVPVDQRFEHRA